MRNFNLTEFESLELASFTDEHPSEGFFWMERALLDISGEKKYVTLVYWDD